VEVLSVLKRGDPLAGRLHERGRLMFTTLIASGADANAFTEYKASKRLYDTSAAVPGANVGSDPARAFILADDSLLKTVRVENPSHTLPADTDDDVSQVSAEALPFAGIGVKDFLPQAQQQVGEREQLMREASAHVTFTFCR
jgi:hypothetical protein